ncbi:TniQ family protein [Methylobacterium sp. WL8]|uniref:TniQ family protein n=1 Tax=Methylobacterium sp. WL8 TaxID=2603899 RepID=UPI0011C8685B|nr:TniQ family protein [Methylobacterium sp. WL8]TXN83152.1 TniQ family protein [Methylobacterium sp. WL8]
MRLEPCLPHMPGETLPSYVSRLAFINGIRSGRELCSDLGISVEGLVGGMAGSVARICELTGSQAETLMRECRRRNGNRYLLRGQSLVVASFLGANVRICPTCLAEDGSASNGGVSRHLAAYGRTTWTVAHLRTCPAHETVLVDLPGIPKAIIQDFTTIVAPFYQGGRIVMPDTRRRSVSTFEAYLLDRLEGRPTECWLDGIPFHAVARTCEMMGAVSAFGRKLSLKMLTNNDWAPAGKEGFDIASGGPASIDQWLGDLIHGYEGDRATPVGPQAWFGDLYRWLDTGTKDADYDLIRDILARCVAERAPFHCNERMFGEPVPYRKVHSLRTAANETGLGAPRLRKALDHGGYLPTGHASYADHEVTFDAVATSELLGQLSKALSLVDVAAVLQITWAQARQLARARYLRALDGNVAATANHCFDVQEIERFLDRLYAEAKTVASVPPGSCNLRAATRKAKCSLVDVVSLVANRSLRWIGRLAGAEGFSAILVNVQEIRAHVRRPELVGHTRSDLEVMLRIPFPTVIALTERGIIPTTVQRHPSILKDIVVIAPEALEHFCAKYAKSADTARALGLPFKGLRATLAARGITPALSKAEFHLDFYERSLLPKIPALTGAGMEKQSEAL